MIRICDQEDDGHSGVDFMDPWFQDAPESRAILDLLRKLTEKFQDLPEETTDIDWTAFRALAKAGAAEGIIWNTCTYADADGPCTEYFLVRGDYPSAMPSRPFLVTEPYDSALVRARLTTTGVRWAEYLASEESQSPEKVRGAVLRLLWNAQTPGGSVQRVPPPANSNIASVHTGVSGSCDQDADREEGYQSESSADDPDRGEKSKAQKAAAASEKDQNKKRGKRGPARMPLKQAWKYVTIVQEWAGISESNKKLPTRKRKRKVQLAEKHGITVRELDAMLAWYAKRKRQGQFPNDPRTLSKGELKKWFE